MSTDLGKAYVQIVPSAQGISGSMTAALSPAAATAGTSAGSTVAKNMGAQINQVGKKFVAAGAIATAVSVPIVNGIKDAMSAYEVQATAEAKLTEIYRSRMGVTGEAAKKTMELASALQKEGVIGDEVAISGAQQLATFAKYPSTINTLLPSMENLLAQQKGVNATSEDAVNIGNLMGKVMQGQTGALKRVGISFTEAQEQVLKYGTEEEKAATLAEVINSNVGNMNQTLAQTPAGRIQQLKNSLGDIKEQIGATLAPVLADVASFVSDKFVPALQGLISFLQEHPVIAKIALALTGLLAVGGPLLMMLGSIMVIAPMIGTAFAALAGPIGIVIAAIGAVIAIGVLLYKHWDQVKATAGKVWQGIKDNIVKPVQNAVASVKKWFEQLKLAIGLRINLIKTAVGEKFKAIKDAMLKPFRAARDAIKAIVEKIKGFFDFKAKIPKIKLPHFSITPKGWKLSDLLEGSIPSLGIDWYAKGGLVNKPTVIGAGDVRGGEGIVPLDPFWAKMDAMADSIVNGFATIAAAGTGGGGEINLDVYLYPSGPRMMEETVKMYDKGKKILG